MMSNKLLSLRKVTSLYFYIKFIVYVIFVKVCQKSELISIVVRLRNLQFDNFVE
jgi:hypothetical protein